MIDFCELPQDGVKFEQLIREIFIRSGFEVHWTGVGPDGGRDLVVAEIAQGSLAPFRRKWLVSCKHYAHSKSSVGLDDIRDLIDSCHAIGATGYLLACSTQPSASVVRRFEELENKNGIVIRYWDGIEIAKRLYTPATLPLIHLFFPISSKDIGWHIYNTYSPSFWAATYKDYFMYLSCRLSNSFPYLNDLETIIGKLESIPLVEFEKVWHKCYLRPRAVYFDDKYDGIIAFADYLFPAHEIFDEQKSRYVLDQILQDGQGLYSDEESTCRPTRWDIKFIACNQVSDSFHPDHRCYYEPYMNNFRVGYGREGYLSEGLYLEDLVNSPLVSIS